MAKVYKQWELERGDKVKLSDGSELIFIKMDGMYAQWEQESGKVAIGNFAGFKKVNDYYVPLTA